MAFAQVSHSVKSSFVASAHTVDRVDSIAKGMNPEALPIDQPTKFLLR